MLKNKHGLKTIIASMVLTVSCVAYSGDSYITASLGFMDIDYLID